MARFHLARLHSVQSLRAKIAVSHLHHPSVWMQQFPTDTETELRTNGEKYHRQTQMFSSVCLVMLVPLLFLFPLILFQSLLHRYLEEGELSKRHFHSGRIHFHVMSQIKLKPILWEENTQRIAFEKSRAVRRLCGYVMSWICCESLQKGCPDAWQQGSEF